MELVNEGNFSCENIAFQLFLDVIQWYSLDSSYQMRYSSETKHFWSLGYKLFKEKFIRFMGGYKHSGNILGGKKCLSPEKSKVNFKTPNIQSLREFVKQ
jgi:hypothetical protein